MDNHKDIAKPELVHKLEGCTDEVNGAVVIPGKNTDCIFIKHLILVLCCQARML